MPLQSQTQEVAGSNGILVRTNSAVTGIELLLNPLLSLYPTALTTFSHVSSASAAYFFK
jgi:hypothetical protein